MFQVDLSEVEGVRAGSDMTGPGSILVARAFYLWIQGLLPVWPGAFYLGAQGLLPVWSGVFYFTRRTWEVHNCFKPVSMFVIRKILR